jgi:hypothetical protein
MRIIKIVIIIINWLPNNTDKHTHTDTHAHIQGTINTH